MELSTRVVVMVASLVLLAFVIVAAGVVSASPKHNDKEKEHPTTFTILTKDHEVRVVDVGPSGPSHGDMRVGNSTAYNASGTRKIGRIYYVCVLTDPADKSNEQTQAARCSYTDTLPGGEINIEGVNYRSDLSKLPSVNTDAIVGGTGKYVGAQGEVSQRIRGENVYTTFHFVD